MDASYTRRLIKKLLDSRDLMPETREELADYLSDADKGALHADDAAYVEALARRLGIAAGGAPADPYAAEAMGDSLAENFADEDEDEGYAGTAAAVQMEIALHAVEQARDLAARLRSPEGGGAPADAATLEELDKVLGEAADALTPRG